MTPELLLFSIKIATPRKKSETANFGNESEPYLSALVFIQQPLARSFPRGIKYFAHTVLFNTEKQLQFHVPTFLMRLRIANTAAGL